MKSTELLPTEENLFSTYKNDTIGRNIDLHYFIDMLDCIDGCCSIALDGRWGSGKTFFVKQTKIIIDSFNEHISKSDNCDEIKTIWKYYHNNDAERVLNPQVCVYYDAWENDNDEDPILSIVYEIIKSVNADYTITNGLDCVKLFAEIADMVTGLSLKSVIDSIKNGENPLTKLKSEKNLKEQIDIFLKEAIYERGNRMIIFIDELDRCKPHYAVKLLERIKHYFSNEKITFVFSINTLELQNTIKQCYGNAFDACKYLDRFFDLRIGLPKPDMKKFYKSIGFNDTYYTYDSVMDALIDKYSFEMREISRFVRLSQMAAYEPTHRGNERLFFRQNALEFCMCFIVPLMIALKMYDVNLYQSFIDGKTAEPLVDLLDVNIFKDWIISILDKSNNHEQTQEVLIKTVREIYNCLFGFFDKQYYEKSVGDMQFTKTTKDTVVRIASLLSQYANYEH